MENESLEQPSAFKEVPSISLSASELKMEPSPTKPSEIVADTVVKKQNDPPYGVIEFNESHWLLCRCPEKLLRNLGNEEDAVKAGIIFAIELNEAWKRGRDDAFREHAYLVSERDALRERVWELEKDVNELLAIAESFEPHVGAGCIPFEGIDPNEPERVSLKKLREKYPYRIILKDDAHHLG